MSRTRKAFSIVISLSILVGCSSTKGAPPTLDQSRTTQNICGAANLGSALPNDTCDDPGAPPDFNYVFEPDENGYYYTSFDGLSGHYIIGGSPILLQGQCTSDTFAGAAAAALALFYAWKSAAGTIRANPSAIAAMNAAWSRYAATGGIGALTAASGDFLLAATTALGVTETLALIGTAGLSGYYLYRYIACLVMFK